MLKLKGNKTGSVLHLLGHLEISSCHDPVKISLKLLHLEVTALVASWLIISLGGFAILLQRAWYVSQLIMYLQLLYCNYCNPLYPNIA